jgi:hypothetical protein
MSIPFKPARCPHCKKKMDSGQRIHPACIEGFSQAKEAKSIRAHAKRVLMAAKVDKALTRQKRESLKSKAHHAKDAQTAVNKYVRLRDAHLGCVSCDKPASWDGQWHASHFRSVGAATSVRFHLWNIHKSCSVCNSWKSGNLSEYEPRLREKIGPEKVDWLRTQNHLSAYSGEYLKRLKAIFTKRAKRFKEMT